MILEILNFTFSSFWIFCGMLMLIFAIGLSISIIISSFFSGNRSYSLINFSKEDKPVEEEHTKPLDIERMTGKSSTRTDKR